MEVIKLNRTGRRRFDFLGKEIFRFDTRDGTSSSWLVVRGFDKLDTEDKTPDGFVVGIALLTSLDGKRDNYTVRKARTGEEVVKIVRERVPSAPWMATKVEEALRLKEEECEKDNALKSSTETKEQ